MASSRERPGRLRRAARPLVGASVAILLFFALGEIVARSFHLVDRLNKFPRHLYRATDDEELPYLLRPSLDTVARGERVVVDERGLRVSGEEAPPEVDARRILVLGDSVVFGFKMPFEDTLGARLEEELERRTGRPHEVLNAGVEGYNTQNERAWLERYGLALEPDVVVVVFNLNDYDYGPVMGPNGVLTTDRTQRVSTWSLANLSDFYVLLRWLWTVATTPIPAPGPTPAPTPASADASRDGSPSFDPFDRYVSLLRKGYYRDPSDERWPQMIAALRGLRDATESRGLPLLIAILPDGDQIGTSRPDLVPQRRLAAICREEKLDCLDLTAAFEASAGRGPLFLDIMHPNASGHEIVARALADRLAGPSP